MRSLARSSALLPGGRRTKFAVVGVWLVVAMLIGRLAGKFEEVQKNDPVDFLPGSAGTFAVLGVLPLVFLIDTLIVRSLLVPAITLKIGDNVWWPSQLATSAGRHRPGPVAGRPAYETD
jgi:uncharacterized membrane protein YdfJ with MMPL/SSD domain